MHGIFVYRKGNSLKLSRQEKTRATERIRQLLCRVFALPLIGFRQRLTACRVAGLLFPLSIKNLSKSFNSLFSLLNLLFSLFLLYSFFSSFIYFLSLAILSSTLATE